MTDPAATGPVPARTVAGPALTGPVLVVTAVGAERDAVLRGLGDNGAAIELSGITGAPEPGILFDKAAQPVHVLAAGVGPAVAAAGTAIALAVARCTGHGYRLVVSAGIGGAFGGRAAIGDLVIAVRSIAADLGADAPDGFLSVDELGFGTSVFAADAGWRADLHAALPGAISGDVLTISTVTGSAERAAWLAARHPDAAAEAMEGSGVASAADAFGLPFAEVRAISNLIGPRDRDAWRIGAALAALGVAGAALGTLVG